MKDKNMFLLLPFAVAMLVTLIFLAAQIPSAKVDPKHLPVAIVNEDGGEMAGVIVKNLQENAPDAVNFITYTSVEKMKAAMKEREIYGGLVIPTTFSEEIQALSVGTEKANVDIYINEGVNTNVATSMEMILRQVVSAISEKVSTQMLTQMEQMAIQSVQPEKVTLLANPIAPTVWKENAVGQLGSVPGALFVPLWMASIIGAVMLHLAGSNRTFTDKISARKFQLIQSLIPLVYGLFIGHLVTWYSTWMLGYEFESFMVVSLFSSIAVTAFVYLILAAISWIGIYIMALFALMMFFGLPLIQLAKEMIPSFYGDYILPWLPIRFLVDGLKEVLFFSMEIINDYSIVLLCIAIGGFILIWVRNLTKKISFTQNSTIENVEKNNEKHYFK